MEPKERIGNNPDHIINSKIMEKDYLIHMSFPKNYSTNDTITYPVLYVLDGKSTYKYFNSSNIDFEKIEDVILVGISHKVNGIESRVNRFNDYTAYRDTISDRKFEKKFGVEKQKYNLSDGHLAKMLVDQGQRTECYVKHVHPQTLGVCQFTKDYIKAAKEAGLCVVAEGAEGRRIFLEYILVVSDAKSLDRLQLTKFRKDVLDTVKEQNDYARKCHKTEYVTRVMFVAQTQKEIKDFGANCLFDYNNLDEFKNEEI